MTHMSIIKSQTVYVNKILQNNDLYSCCQKKNPEKTYADVRKESAFSFRQENTSDVQL